MRAMANLFTAIASRFKKKDEEDQMSMPQIKTPKIDIATPINTAIQAISTKIGVPKNINDPIKPNTLLYDIGTGINKVNDFLTTAPVISDVAYKIPRKYGTEAGDLVASGIKQAKSGESSTIPLVNLKVPSTVAAPAKVGLGLINLTPAGVIGSYAYEGTKKAGEIKYGKDSLQSEAIGLAGAILAPGDFKGDVAKASKFAKEIKSGDELASILSKELNIKKIDLNDVNSESIKVAIDKVKDILNRYNLPKDLSSKIKKGEPIIGDNFVLQFNNKTKEALINIDNKFQEILPGLGKIEKADFVDPTTFAKTLDNAEAGGLKDVSKIKMPEYWKPGEIDTNQVNAYKISLQNGQKINPIVLDEAGNVLDGSHRLQALKDLGIKEVETVIQKTKKATEDFQIPQIKPTNNGMVNLKKINVLGPGQETKLLPGESAPLSAKEARAYKKKFGSLPSQVTESLPSSTELPIRLPANADELSKVGPEMGSFLQDTMAQAGKAGNDEILDTAVDMARLKTNIADEFMQTLDEGGYNFIPDINNLPKPIQDAYQAVYQYRVGDLPLDQKLKGIERAKQGIESSVSVAYQQAKLKAQEFLGRALNENEAGALLRGKYSQEFKMAKEGTTALDLGEDILAKEQEISKLFDPVHEEIAANVLLYEDELDKAVRSGFITAEKAKEMRLVQPEQFGANLRNYVRTAYDKSVQELPEADLNLNIVDDVALSFSSAKKKLTDAEWGRAYYQAFKNLQAEQVSKSTDIPFDLLQKIEAGDEGAFAELGRKVKELRGYITEGDKAISRTVNYLANQWSDLKMFNILGERPDLFSKEFKAGFTKVPVDKRYGPMQGMFIRSDIANSFKKEFKYQDVMDSIPGFIDWFGAIWRASRTILNPATYGLNFATGLLGMQTLAGNSPFNPTNWKYFYKAAKEYGEYARTGKIVGKDIEEFLKLGGKQGVFADSVILQGLEDAFSTAKDGGQLSDKLYNLAVKGSEKLEEAGNWFATSDIFNKYATYLNKIDNGFTPVEAAQIADRYHLNYDLAPKFVRFVKNTPVLNTIAPFLAFPIMFTKTFVETSASKPWRLIPMLLAPQLYNMQWKMRNPELAEQMEQQKPYYLKGNPFVVPVGYNEDKKEFKYLDMARFFNIPTGTDEGLRSVFGPFAGNLGGPLTALADVTRGTDAFGRPLNTPYSDTNLEHIIKGTAPIPPVVNQIADLIRTLQGKETRGKVRQPIDEALRIVGIVLSTGSADQLAKNVNAIKNDYQTWKSWASKQLQEPGLSDEGRQEILDTFEQKRQDYIEKVQKYLGTKAQGTPEQFDNFTNGILGGVMDTTDNEILDSFLRTGVSPVGTGDIPELVLSANKGKGIKVKTASPNIKPSTKGIKVSLPKKSGVNMKVKTFEPLKPPSLKGIYIPQSGKKVTLTQIRNIKPPRVSGLNVY